MGDVKLNNYERGGSRGRLIHVADRLYHFSFLLSLTLSSPLLPDELFTFLHHSKAPHPKSTSSFLNASPHPYPPNVFLFLLLLLVMATGDHPCPSPPRPLHPLFLTNHLHIHPESLPFLHICITVYHTTHPFLLKCVISSLSCPCPHFPTFPASSTFAQPTFFLQSRDKANPITVHCTPALSARLG